MPDKKFLLITKKELFYSAVMLRIRKLVNVVYDFPADSLKFEAELRDARKTLRRKNLLEDSARDGVNISFSLSVCVSFCANPDSCDHNKNANDFISCNDYTGNRNGAMLFVNAGQTSISKSAIYAQEAPLACPADRFNFGMSIRNATYVEEDEWKLPVNLTICLLKEFNESARVLPSENDPNVLARISSGDVLAGDDWYRVNEFVSLTDKTDNLWVVIYNNGADGDGNDMILDDITFSVCIPKSQLFATMNGDTLNSNVLTCSGDAVTLHAIQTSSYLENPYYIFQFQKVNGGDTVWTDLNDYKNHPELMRVDTVDVSTNESDFWGKLSYRVIISDDATIARKVADGEYASLTECEFTYHQASTEITIQNTYGGEMAPRDSVAFCNIDGTKVSVRGERKLTKPDHEWTMSWLAADSSVIYTKNVKGVSVDTLTLTVLKGNKFSVKSSDGKDLEERSFPELDSLFFRAIDEGGCEFFQTIVLHEKMNLDVKPTIDTVITDCNSVTVKVQRNYSEPPLRFDWSSVEGDATIVDDTTQTFAPKFVENFSLLLEL